VKTDEDNQSAANPGDKLHESGESSDDMNSQDAEASDREYFLLNYYLIN
jgi:hypothetical protein